MTAHRLGGGSCQPHAALTTSERRAWREIGWIQVLHERVPMRLGQAAFDNGPSLAIPSGGAPKEAGYAIPSALVLLTPPSRFPDATLWPGLVSRIPRPSCTPHESSRSSHLNLQPAAEHTHRLLLIARHSARWWGSPSDPPDPWIFQGFWASQSRRLLRNSLTGEPKQRRLFAPPSSTGGQPHLGKDGGGHPLRGLGAGRT
jgi:hypothetical protein